MCTWDCGSGLNRAYQRFGIKEDAADTEYVYQTKPQSCSVTVFAHTGFQYALADIVESCTGSRVWWHTNACATQQNMDVRVAA